MTSIFLDIRFSLVSFGSQKMLGKGKIIFLSLDNMKNSNGKNVEKKIDLLAYSTSPIFFRVLRLIICVLLFFF